MSVATTDGLASEGRNLVIVALVGTNLHIRIFDANGKRVVDKVEDELMSGETLTTLKKQLTSLPDESGLSQEQKQQIIRDATSIAGHTQRNFIQFRAEQAVMLSAAIWEKRPLLARSTAGIFLTIGVGKQVVSDPHHLVVEIQCPHLHAECTENPVAKGCYAKTLNDGFSAHAHSYL